MYNQSREKGRDLKQSYNKNPYTHKKIQKAMWHYKNATKKLDYTRTLFYLSFVFKFSMREILFHIVSAPFVFFHVRKRISTEC